jgi:hypothetical protein
LRATINTSTGTSLTNAGAFFKGVAPNGDSHHGGITRRWSRIISPPKIISLLSNFVWNMKEFQADFTDHNFQEIFDTIKEYYPIEEQYKDYTPEALRDLAGYQKIWQLVEENFVNKKNYKERWVLLSKYLKTSLKKRVVSSNGMFDCCA